MVRRYTCYESPSFILLYSLYTIPYTVYNTNGYQYLMDNFVETFLGNLDASNKMLLRDSEQIT